MMQSRSLRGLLPSSKRLRSACVPTQPHDVSGSARPVTTTASGFLGLEPYLKGSAGANLGQKPYFSYIDRVRAEHLLDAKLHLGHSKSSINQFVNGHLLGIRHNVAIYDLKKTWKSIRTVFYGFAEMAQSRSAFFLLAPNKKLPMGPLIEKMRNEYPFRHNRFTSLYMIGYAHEKWMDGIFSNWKTMHAYAQKVRAIVDKKPGIKKYRRLQSYMQGLDSLDLYSRVVPDFVLVFAHDRGALHEAANLDLPLVGLVDTNNNPQPFLYPVFANDDSIESMQFMLDLLKRAVEEGRKREHEMFALLMLQKIKEKLHPSAGIVTELSPEMMAREERREQKLRSLDLTIDARRTKDAWAPPAGKVDIQAQFKDATEAQGELPVAQLKRHGVPLQ